jgi:hypothetical protein
MSRDRDTLWLTLDQDGLLTDAQGSAVIVLPMKPDWVTLPPELGSHEVRVLRDFQAPCPICTTHTRTLALEGDLYVASCYAHTDPHMFYRIPK